MSKIAFLGCGNIAKAIVNGAVAAGRVKPAELFCYDIDATKADSFAGLGATPADSAAALVTDADLLFLTVKPQVLPAVLGELKAHLAEKTLIVSPVAGVKIETIAALLGGNRRIIRVMPNTPLMYGAGATAMAKGEGVGETEFAFVERIFASCGVTAVVPEEQIDAVTGISGSSPAFFMRFARAIISAGVSRGMSQTDAERLVLQTMAGTAKMVLESECTMDELIRAVASPNGTTEAGLKAMDASGFDQITKQVIDAAINRSMELSK